eukprot:122656_1
MASKQHFWKCKFCSLLNHNNRNDCQACFQSPPTEITDVNIPREDSLYHDDKCDAKSDDPSQTCNVLKRLICGLQYYMSLDVKNKPDDKDKFNNFICNVYHKFL